MTKTRSGAWLADPEPEPTPTPRSYAEASADLAPDDPERGRDHPVNAPIVGPSGGLYDVAVVDTDDGPRHEIVSVSANPEPPAENPPEA